ncbi:MAG: DNA repair photolyase [Mariniflexile sp.]|jgi:DNA repair photolyase
MKAVTLKEIKQELNTLSTDDVQELCLRLSRFKKENKELLTYLLFESHNEERYIESVKSYIDEQFELINTSSYFYIRKSARKILSNTKKYVRYSQNKETEVALLLYFCQKLKDFSPSIIYSLQLQNMYNRQLLLIKKLVATFHEDLQYDFNLMLEAL